MHTLFLLFAGIGSIIISLEACSIETFESSDCLDSRGSTVSIDSDFYNSMEAICDAAVRCNVKLYITSSFRQPDSAVLGAIVTPATLSNHKIGHAIDMNVVYGKSRTLCNSRCLGGNLPTDVQCLIDEVKSEGLR